MPLPKSTENLLAKYKHGSILIETGTYMGDGVRAAIDAGFDEVWSIELDDFLFEDARKTFSNDGRVHIVHGDSAVQLGKILDSFPPGTDVTLWLDAHASGPLKYDRGTPLLDEVHAVSVSGCRAAILIDDCRLLGSAEWRRVGKDHLEKALKALPYEHTIQYEDGHVLNDIMVITPK